MQLMMFQRCQSFQTCFHVSSHPLHFFSSAFSKLFVKQTQKYGKANMKKTKLRAVAVWTHPSHLTGRVPDILPDSRAVSTQEWSFPVDPESWDREQSHGAHHEPLSSSEPLRGISQLLSLGTEWLYGPSGGKKGFDTNTEDSPATTWAPVLITGSRSAAGWRCCSFTHQPDVLCAEVDTSQKPSWLYCPSSSRFSLSLLMFWSWLLLHLECCQKSFPLFPAPSLLSGSQHLHCASCRQEVTA